MFIIIATEDDKFMTKFINYQNCLRQDSSGTTW